MRPRLQFVRRAIAERLPARRALAIFLLATASICPARARAQGAPAEAIGRVEGPDISVEKGTAEHNGTPAVAPSIDVSNGSIVTVHSGRAKMTLFAGGKVGICGPAKLTLLVSGDAITLALSFGRVRVELPAKTALRVFTPSIIGTPLDISGGSRDVTMGLNLDDSLCVLATSGAIQLEHQFTGEKLIVPQAGEFFLNAGKLLPVAGTPGGCDCLALEPRETPTAAGPPPEFAAATAPPQVDADPRSSVAATEPPAESSVHFVLPARANEAHPVAPGATAEVPGEPLVAPQVYAEALPALTFMASSPPRPPDAWTDIQFLIRNAQISPDYEFSGRVEAPEFAKEMQHALGEKDSAPPMNTAGANQSAAKQSKRKSGFWASLKRAFGGS
ncbi:MAG TPA: hypothetical protein VJO53_03505 [Candidatus Acidoferrales bacterium]|nr:hypothetical protein [Candidatus Acidoferrales bacterium]